MAKRVLTQGEIDERKLMASLKRLAKRVNREKAKVSPVRLCEIYENQSLCKLENAV